MSMADTKEDTEPIESSNSDYNGPDLEKQDTEPQSLHSSTSHTVNDSAPIRHRVTRTQSLTRRNTRRNFFTHPLAHVKTTDAEIVDFDGPNDPYHPLNWPFRKKVITTLLYGLTTMGATWASSVYSPAIQQIAGQYHVGTEVSLLGLTFLLMGFGLGPLLWAPLSEVYVNFMKILSITTESTCYPTDSWSIRISLNFVTYFHCPEFSNVNIDMGGNLPFSFHTSLPHVSLLAQPRPKISRRSS
jgi:hypothetical protein